MNFYEVLNVSPKATEKDIKKAYRTLAKKYHPDTYTGDKEFAKSKMQEINIAYDTLSDSNSRKKYDESIGVNIKEPNQETYKQQSKNTAGYSNPYNKSGVNYDVKYRPNNGKIQYDSRGYAESNYYTSENSQSYKSESDFSLKKIKEVFAGKNLSYTLIIAVLVIGILSLTIYKVVESMNEFFESTQGVYNKLNTAREENKKPIQSTEINLNENLYPVIEETAKSMKNKSEEFFNNLQKKQQEENNSKTESKSTEEILIELGITDEEDQKSVLDFLEQLNANN